MIIRDRVEPFEHAERRVSTIGRLFSSCHLMISLRLLTVPEQNGAMINSFASKKRICSFLHGGSFLAKITVEFCDRETDCHSIIVAIIL